VPSTRFQTSGTQSKLAVLRNVCRVSTLMFLDRGDANIEVTGFQYTSWNVMLCLLIIFFTLIKEFTLVEYNT